MPEEMTFRPREELLQDDEILRLVGIFADLGFKKIRLTGGEPTVRANVIDIVQQIAATPGIRTLAMTTNGLLLDRLAKPLAEAGLQRVNISIDTLESAKFKTVTRWGCRMISTSETSAPWDSGLVLITSLIFRSWCSVSA